MLYAGVCGALGLLASCAGAPPVPAFVASTADAGFRPVPRSTLVSNRELDFVLARHQRGADSTTVLALRQDRGTPRPLARLVQVGQGPQARVSVQWRQPPEPGGTGASQAQEIALLEQLYAVILRMEPEARYCLGGMSGLGSEEPACDAAHDGLTHMGMLLALTAARERAAAGMPAATPWRPVEMQRAPTRTWDPDVVGVVATNQHGPLAGAAIYFNRAPHSLCIARTNAAGVAICRLVDQHGDAHEHDHSAPVHATFPGEVRTDRVLPPITYVMSTPAAFARPYLVPGLPGKP